MYTTSTKLVLQILTTAAQLSRHSPCCLVTFLKPSPYAVSWAPRLVTAPVAPLALISNILSHGKPQNNT